MTVGELKQALASAPDDMIVLVETHKRLDDGDNDALDAHELEHTYLMDFGTVESKLERFMIAVSRNISATPLI